MARSDSDDKSSNSSEPSWSMRTSIAAIKMKFPRVKNITTDDLNKQMESCSQAEATQAEGSETKKCNLLILDVRPNEEYGISHIEGATRVNPNGSDLPETRELIKEKNADQVVCYCSIGYRSSYYANELGKYLKDHPLERYPNIHNLEGSLFKWANEGRPMKDDKDQKTIYCHPYDFIWGKMLNAELRRNSKE